MNADPRGESIRAAYDAATFDERTPDERGFGARFESEFKPLLKIGVGFNLGVMDRRRRRRRNAKLIMAGVAIGFIPTLILLNVADGRIAEFTFFVLVFLGIGLSGWALRKRPDEEDPTHAILVQAVLESFGCRVEREASAHHPVASGAPIFPGYTNLAIMPEHIAGRFDGHLAFTAQRVKATRKEGKKTRTTFTGWYLRIDLPFSFSGVTAISDVVGPWKLLDDEGMKDVRLESPEFSQLLRVRSTDQVEARMILSPDVMQHLTETVARNVKLGPDWAGSLMLGFSGSRAHVWMPSKATALSDWRPLEPGRLIEDLHEAFAELAEMRSFLRDIDVIAESEGFRAQTARNAARRAS